MMEGTEQNEVAQAGLAASGAFFDVVHLAGVRWDVAARERTMPVAGDDRTAKCSADQAGWGAGVQRQADRGELIPGQPGAQERGQPAGAGENVSGMPEQGLVQPGQCRWVQRSARVRMAGGPGAAGWPGVRAAAVFSAGAVAVTAVLTAAVVA